jgi:hypothetical protein
MRIHTHPRVRNQVPWRFLSDQAKIHLAVDALLEDGSCPFALTVNLNPQLAERAATDLDWLRRRFALELKRKLGRNVPLVLTFQQRSAAGRLHVHGALDAKDEHEVDLIKKALKVAAGNWDSHGWRCCQVHTQPLYSDRWSGYITKHSIGWTMSNELRQMAKERSPMASDTAVENQNPTAFCHLQNHPAADNVGIIPVNNLLTDFQAAYICDVHGTNHCDEPWPLLPQRIMRFAVRCKRCRGGSSGQKW